MVNPICIWFRGLCFRGSNPQVNIETNKSSRVIHQWSKNPYAYLNPWQSINDLKFLSDVFKKDIVVRISEEPFEIDGVSYDRGTLVITRKANEKLGLKFDTILSSRPFEKT